MADGPIEISDEVKKKLLNQSALPTEITLGGRQYTPEAAVGAGFKAVVWKVLDEYARPRALKLATYQDYLERSWSGELTHAAPLDRYPVFARIVDAGRAIIPLEDGSTFDAVFFVEDWVEGVALREFLRERAKEIDAAFLLHYADNMTRALEALDFHKLAHDDLHDGNVMLAEPVPGDDGHMQVRVIDMGSLKPAIGIPRSFTTWITSLAT